MSNSTPSDVNRNEDRAEELRKKAGRFRILIIGRANSGKTTILQKICKTDENPDIFNGKGEKVRRMCLYYVSYILLVSIRSISMSLNHLNGLACPSHINMVVLIG
jgi:septin family protein